MEIEASRRSIAEQYVKEILRRDCFRLFLQNYERETTNELYRI